MYAQEKNRALALKSNNSIVRDAVQMKELANEISSKKFEIL